MFIACLAPLALAENRVVCGAVAGREGCRSRAVCPGQPISDDIESFAQIAASPAAGERTGGRSIA